MVRFDLDITIEGEIAAFGTPETSREKVMWINITQPKFTDIIYTGPLPFWYEGKAKKVMEGYYKKNPNDYHIYLPREIRSVDGISLEKGLHVKAQYKKEIDGGFFMKDLRIENLSIRNQTIFPYEIEIKGKNQITYFERFKENLNRKDEDSQ
jgi:hypothetical protein